jgi:CheY-like chemotaxis protein
MPTQLALLGFTPFERSSFQSFFDLGRAGGRVYEFVNDLWRAECVIADADDDEAMARVLHAGLLERSVLLGSTPHAGAALQLPRPINLLLVMRALAALVGPEAVAVAGAAEQVDDEEHSPQADPPVEPGAGVVASSEPEITARVVPEMAPEMSPETAPEAPRGSHVQRVLDELAFRTATLPSNMDARAYAQAALSAARHGSASSSAGSKRSSSGRASKSVNKDAMEHVLVIDHDATTLRMVAVQLQRFGFQMHLAGHPDDALRLLARRFYDFVFVDPALPGLDALLVCRLARQVAPPGERCATTIVLLADPSAPAAPLERALPAADACLKKPLTQRTLLKLVGEREVARYAYADTARTTTLI